MKVSQRAMSNIENPRRGFLKFGFAGITAALSLSLFKHTFAKPPIKNDKAIVVHEEEGKHIIMGRSKALMTIKFSAADHGIESTSFCTEDIVPGRKMPVHKHLYNDEVIFIQSGAGILTLDEKTIDVKTGTVVFVPRGVWHGLENPGTENIRMVFQYTPAGFEEYFVENGTAVGEPMKTRTKEEYAATEKKYGMVYKVPR
ncbi:Cupin domain-containing protein [Ohtaekwangia koreensis]|uniref:Cupin domain-containing protein n=2 Tax=Ohtaekwangia koreensis TaxID=688867 RepID=A0A1T5M679_9BACT|nr:Cupin domain-containing protein [Ohtaekwangia koreensis]